MQSLEINHRQENLLAKAIPPVQRKKTMSVAEMREILGIGKTDSYWLVKKKPFRIIEINQKMRIDIDSFEQWYSNQTHYRKVNGPPPGASVKELSYSVPELAEMLSVTESTAYTLIQRYEIPTIQVDFRMRVPKDSFEQWYSGQSIYRTEEDRQKDAAKEAESMSMPEMARLLGVSRERVYSILGNQKNKDVFEIIIIGGRKRVTKKSFHAWYATAESFHRLSALSEEKKQEEVQTKSPLYYTPDEVHDIYGYSKTTIYQWIKTRKIPVIRIGQTYRIPKEPFDVWIGQNHH